MTPGHGGVGGAEIEILFEKIFLSAKSQPNPDFGALVNLDREIADIMVAISEGDPERLANVALVDKSHEHAFQLLCYSLIDNDEVIPRVARALFRKINDNARSMKPAPNQLRDFLIVMGIQQLVAAGYTATRGDWTGSDESACDVIRRALEKSGTHLSYGGVKKVWIRHLKQSRT